MAAADVHRAEDYSPEPWILTGQSSASVFLVPRGEVDLTLPSGTRAVTVAGRLVVGAAWFVYDDTGGILQYNEFMTTVLLRRGLRLLPSVVQIWVDSVESRDGGRALWAIPKELAEFGDHPPETYEARLGDTRIATVRLRHVRGLPGRWPVRFHLAQRDERPSVISPVRATARIALAGSSWDVPADSPVRYLAGRKPLITVALQRFRMVFGTTPGGNA